MDITFGHTKSQGDIDKDVPLKLVEDVIVKKDESHPIEDEFNKSTPISFDKTADLPEQALHTPNSPKLHFKDLRAGMMVTMTDNPELLAEINIEPETVAGKAFCIESLDRDKQSIDVSFWTPGADDIDILEVPFEDWEEFLTPTGEYYKFETTASSKIADLYHGYLFTVVPKKFDMHNDITPPDQGFEDKYVLLWDTYDGMFKFKEDIWKKLRVQVPKDLLGTKIFKGPTDVYYIGVVPAEWIVGEESSSPRYVQ